MEFKIHVTPDDIRYGQHDKARTCPIALAAKREFGEGHSIYVNPVELHVDGRVYPLPDIAVEFIARFDTRQFVRPITFEVE